MKQFDVAVLGSTGFTGRLVCKHIVQQYHGKGSFTWAMAGRSKAKLQEIRTWLAEDGVNLDDVKLVEADVNNQAALNELAAASSVVITAVGPYALYGRPVVKACVENKAHYCDITGEPNFILKTRQEFDDAAKANGVRIVHSCGFDSVPSEVMTLQAAHYMSENYNMPLGGGGNGVGGGTIDSGVNLVRESVLVGDGDAKKAMSHPYSLIPNFDDKEALQELPDRGKHMVYSERWGMTFSDALIRSIIGAIFPVVLYLAARFQWFRKMLPAAGDGPDGVLDDSFYIFSCWALPDTSGAPPEQSGAPWRLKSTFALMIGDCTITTRLLRIFDRLFKTEDMKRCGGYWSTARMLLECGLCMIPENEKLLAEDPYASTCPAGVLAPTAALGLVLHDRLRSSGFTLEVEDVPAGEDKKAA